MKKTIYGLFIVLFLVLCLTPSVGMLFAPAERAANEKLAPEPSLHMEDGSLNLSVLPDTAQWVNDRFFLRTQLIGLDRLLCGKLLATSGEPSVVLGKDGWLFYEPTVKNFTQTETMTDQELRWAAHNLSLMARYCRENGKDFLFVIAPNKNRLYGQFMPSYGITAGTSDARRLHGFLEEMDVKYADLFAAFGKESELLYFAHDSHWNSKGAALGADVINAGFGLQTAYFAEDFSGSVPHTGDLFAMLYPGFTDPETDPVYGGTLSYGFTGKATKPDAITLETEGQGQGRLLAYRDSFGNLLYPYLADSAQAARFSRATVYDLTLEADRVLIELVERNLSYLITYGAFMPAPASQMQVPEATAGEVSFTAGKRGELVQVKGSLPQTAEAVWVVADGICYEAFLLKDGGFLASLPEAEYNYVVCKVGDGLTMYDLTLEDN